jgi:uncharacterized membrane protein YhiD involved in acid resistance
MKLARTLAFLVVLVTPLAAQVPVPTGDDPKNEAQLTRQKDDGSVEAPDWQLQIQQLQHALVRLPMAAALATILAVRPRRRGTPPRQAPVVQTQIILAVVGAVVMLVVGSSLARAFGIVGAAGLVRYRAKVSDPKDAGVMLSTLAVGLASGVGIWMIAIFATVFILGVLWVIESFEPKAKHEFALTVKSKDPTVVKTKLEELLSHNRVNFELRSATEEQLVYEVRMPIAKKTDHLSELILKLDPQHVTGVEWDEKKAKT